MKIKAHEEADITWPRQVMEKHPVFRKFKKV